LQFAWACRVNVAQFDRAEAASKKSHFIMKAPAITKPKTWTELEKRQLETLVRRGARTREITSKLGRHARSVKEMARQLKLLLLK
jgi:hypothetical protein